MPATLKVQTCTGFPLTLISVQLTPFLVAWVGWRYAFLFLAIGPFLGIIAMIGLDRRLRERWTTTSRQSG